MQAQLSPFNDYETARGALLVKSNTSQTAQNKTPHITEKTKKSPYDSRPNRVIFKQLFWVNLNIRKTKLARAQ